MSHRGRLMVATPLIGDSNFERSVVLLLAHGPDGAFGVVLNRPSDVPAAHVVPDWDGGVAAPAVVFLGGPVEPERVIGIGRIGNHPALPSVGGFHPLLGNYDTVDLDGPPPPVADEISGVRLFAGSAGWAPGQLEDEIREGAWWPCDAGPTDVATTDPSGLWCRVLRRQPGEVAWFANHPADPSQN